MSLRHLPVQICGVEWLSLRVHDALGRSNNSRLPFQVSAKRLLHTTLSSSFTHTQHTSLAQYPYNPYDLIQTTRTIKLKSEGMDPQAPAQAHTSTEQPMRVQNEQPIAMQSMSMWFAIL